MDVRIINEQLEIVAEPDYLRVQVTADPADDTVTLATIERITAWGSQEAAMRKKTARQVRPLVVNRPMSSEEALVLAKSYAEHKHIAVVLADQPSQR